MEQNSGNFFDSKTILAIVMVGLVWFGWQSYLNKYYPQLAQKKEIATKTEAEKKATDEKIATSVQKEATEEKTKPESSTKIDEKQEATPEELIEFSGENISFQISSKGMGIKNFKLNKRSDRSKQPIHLGDSLSPILFELSLVDQKKPLRFNVEKKGDFLFEGKAKEGSLTITQSIEVDEVRGVFRNKIKIQDPSKTFPGLKVNIPEKIQETKASTFFMPNYDYQEFVVNYSGKLERVSVSSSTESVEKSFNSVGMVAIGSQYFTTAIVDKSELIPDVNINSLAVDKKMLAALIYKPANNTKENLELNYIGYAGAKSINILESIDQQLIETINFGFFSAIAKILLIVLKWFYVFVGNWGLAIILLTLLVRMIVLPFNIASYRSMKKMQKIQPMIQALREKNKDDAQAQNREMMALMKENRVNPLGGCLPMLLQMPVFFALYQVLGQSIELYQAPFFGWINDLSLKDPYYVLPVLMGLAMYFQQKMTPSTMDPAQAKVMQFMPIIFSLMMLTLPSGLTLYIFVSTVFGLVQQYLFMREKTQQQVILVQKKRS